MLKNNRMMNFQTKKKNDIKSKSNDDNKIKNKIIELIENTKSHLFPSYTFRLCVINFILIGGLIMFYNIVEKRNKINSSNLYSKKIKEYIKKSHHYFVLSKQDNDITASYSHIIKSEHYLKEAKELADGKEALASLCNIDYDMTLHFIDEQKQNIIEKINKNYN